MVNLPAFVEPTRDLVGRVARVRLNDNRTFVAEVRTDFGHPAWSGSWHGFTLEKGKPIEVLEWLVIPPLEQAAPPEGMRRLLVSVTEQNSLLNSFEVDVPDVYKHDSHVAWQAVKALSDQAGQGGIL